MTDDQFIRASGMMFKVEITMENGDKYSFIAKSVSGYGADSITLSNIQDVKVLEEWDRKKTPEPLPIVGNPGVKFAPNKR